MKIGFALGGGGARGLAHLGVLRALEEEGITPKFVAGTSAGSLAGAIYGLYGFEECVKLVKDIVKSERYRKMGLSSLDVKKGGLKGGILNFIKEGITFTKAIASKSILSGDDLRAMVEKLIKDKTFSDLPYEFFAVALDIENKKDVIFRSGSLLDALYSSCAIPGIFPPLRKDGMVLVDGGPTALVPVEALILRGADFIIAVDVSGGSESSFSDGNAVEIMLRADRVAAGKLSRIILSLADFVIKPDLGDMNWLNFEKVDAAVQKGYETTKTLMPQLTSTLRKHNIFKKLLKRALFKQLKLNRFSEFV